MTWVKVCGLTRDVDVASAVDARADAVGFVNVPQSPRFIDTERISALASDVPIDTVLLTVDMEPPALLETLAATGVKGVQPYGLHRQESAAIAVAEGYFVLYPAAATADIDISSLPGMPLLDTPSGSKLGGTGRTFDWSGVANLAGDFVLAGGLGPDNVAEAISQVRPWGVDASSGLELSPGVKDSGMVADFIARAKNET